MTLQRKISKKFEGDDASTRIERIAKRAYVSALRLVVGDFEGGDDDESAGNEESTASESQNSLEGGAKAAGNEEEDTNLKAASSKTFNTKKDDRHHDKMRSANHNSMLDAAEHDDKQNMEECVEPGAVAAYPEEQSSVQRPKQGTSVNPLADDAASTPAEKRY